MSTPYFITLDGIEEVNTFHTILDVMLQKCEEDCVTILTTLADTELPEEEANRCVEVLRIIVTAGELTRKVHDEFLSQAKADFPPPDPGRGRFA